MTRPVLNLRWRLPKATSGIAEIRHAGVGFAAFALSAEPWPHWRVSYWLRSPAGTARYIGDALCPSAAEAIGYVEDVVRTALKPLRVVFVRLSGGGPA